MSETDNVQVLRDSIRRHNDPDRRDSYLDDYSEDIVVHGADVDGIEELRGFYRHIWEVLPDLTVTIEGVAPGGDEVAVRYSWEGTHAETGRTVALESGLTWYRFEDGEITERWIPSGVDEVILGRIADASQAE